MESARRALFENPLGILVVLGVAEVAILAFWHSRRTPRWRAAVLVPPVLAGAVALTAALVKTDRERIAAAIETIAAHVEARDFAAAGRYLDPKCRAARSSGLPLGRQVLIACGQAAMARYPVETIRATAIETAVAGANATTALDTRIVFRTGETFRLGWKIQWARRPAGWRVVEVEITYPRALADFRF